MFAILHRHLSPEQAVRALAGCAFLFLVVAAKRWFFDNVIAKRCLVCALIFILLSVWIYIFRVR